MIKTPKDFIRPFQKSSTPKSKREIKIPVINLKYRNTNIDQFKLLLTLLASLTKEGNLEL